VAWAGVVVESHVAHMPSPAFALGRGQSRERLCPHIGQATKSEPMPLPDAFTEHLKLNTEYLSARVTYV
jgi:hypothetical protein